MADTPGYYEDYLARTPHQKSHKLMRRWHERLFLMSLRQSGLGLDFKGKVLEVGYGHGFLATVLHEYGWEYLGADISQPLVDLAVSQEHDVRLPENLEVSSDGKCDLLWLSHVVEHAPSWDAARNLLLQYRDFLAPGGRIVIVGPDLLSWKTQFWSGDFSHGYPTTKRNVIQLLRDTGFRPVSANYHRSASKNLLVRALCGFVSRMPDRPIDYLINRERAQVGEGFFYSWKTVFGWRQVMVIGERAELGAG